MINLSRWNLASYALMTVKETIGANSDVSNPTPDAQTVRTPKTTDATSQSSDKKGKQATDTKSTVKL